MTKSPLKRAAGFTLVELLIGMTLSLMVMGAVLSGYIFLGRNFTRSLGLSSANGATLESQSRRSLDYLAQDVRMASALDITTIAPRVAPFASGVTLILPVASGTNHVTYYFNGTSSAVTLASFTVPANSLARIDESAGTIKVLQTNLLTLYFRYFDTSGQPYDNSSAPYTTSTVYLAGIKQLSLQFITQGGSAVNGTQTPLYSSASPRLILRNRQLLP